MSATGHDAPTHGLPTANTAKRSPVTEALRKVKGLERFDMRDELGAGGMGSVILATDRALRRDVAIKVLHVHDQAELQERFVEEAQITGQLEHPNIVPVHELGFADDGRPWLAMKRIKGETLHDRIALERKGGGRPLTPEAIADIIDIMRKACDALAFAHDRRVVHRDLKPQNVMIGDYGEVLVLDWGLARPLDLQPPSSGTERVTGKTSGAVAAPRDKTVVRTDLRDFQPQLTLDGRIRGTPSYMAPEQAEGRNTDIDHRADIFALGGILYALLTLTPPYEGQTALAALKEAIDHNLVPARKRAPQRAIPAELDSIVMKAMAKDRNQRYQTATELKDDLLHFQSFRPVSAHRDGLIQKARKYMRRHPTFAATLFTGLFFAALGSSAGFYIWTLKVEAERTLNSNKLQSLAQQGEIEKLLEELGGSLKQRRDELTDNFAAAWREAESNGVSLANFVEGLGEERVSEYVKAFEGLIAARAKFGEGIPIDAADYFFLGMLYQAGRDDLERAAAMYTETIRLDPEHTGAWYNRAAIRLQQGDRDAAMRDYDHILEARGEPTGREEPAPVSTANVAGGFGALVNIAKAAGELSGEVAPFVGDIDMRPSLADVYYNRGVSSHRAGDLRTAMREYNSAIQRDPNHAPSFCNRGLTFKAMGNAEAARKDLDRAVRLAPRHPVARFNRAVLLRELDEPALALIDLKAVLERRPTWWAALCHQGSALAAIDDRDGATAAFDKAEASAPDDRRPIVRGARARALDE